MIASQPISTPRFEIAFTPTIWRIRRTAFYVIYSALFAPDADRWIARIKCTKTGLSSRSNFSYEMHAQQSADRFRIFK